MSRCGVCGVRASSFQLYRNKFIEAKKADLTNPEVVDAQKVFFYLVIQYNKIASFSPAMFTWSCHCLSMSYRKASQLWFLCISMKSVFFYWTELPRCLSILQDSLCSCRRFSSTSIIKSYVMGNRFGSWATRCILVKSLDPLQTDLAPEISDTCSKCCFHVRVHYPCRICPKHDATRAAQKDVSKLERSPK